MFFWTYLYYYVCNVVLTHMRMLIKHASELDCMLGQWRPSRASKEELLPTACVHSASHACSVTMDENLFEKERGSNSCMLRAQWCFDYIHAGQDKNPEFQTLREPLAGLYYTHRLPVPGLAARHLKILNVTYVKMHAYTLWYLLN
jgi:hypothetical protein